MPPSPELVADASSTGAWAALGTVGGVAVTVAVSQWNRRRDMHRKDSASAIASRVADTEAALEAWNKINSFQAQQIADLGERVSALQRRVDNYEQQVIPELQDTLAEMRAAVADKQRTIDELIAQLKRVGGTTPP